MKKLIVATFATAAIAGLTACAPSPNPLPQGPAAKAPVAEAPAADASSATSCDVAREALLTGTPVDITSALKALQADKTADATAREYARYYTGRDKGDKTMQEMDISLIQMACTL